MIREYQTAIICDIDGTLAHMVDRGPFDWKKVSTDRVDEVIRGLVYSARFHCGHTIILLSGRNECSRALTEEWLSNKYIAYHHLFMRKDGDNRNDAVVKKEIYEREIKGRYEIEYVLDDRNRVVDMWRSIGLKCLQVAPGDF